MKLNKKGLTLLEIIVSAVLLSIVIAALANLYVAGKRYVLLTRYKMTGGELGKAFIDPLQLQVRQDQWTQNCLSSNPVQNCPGNSTIQNIQYTPTYNIDTVAGTSLRRVTATIRWDEIPPQ